MALLRQFKNSRLIVEVTFYHLHKLIQYIQSAGLTALFSPTFSVFFFFNESTLIHQTSIYFAFFCCCSYLFRSLYIFLQIKIETILR